MNRICTSLAGRASEVLELDEEGISTGASADLKSAAKTAMAMVCDYGMMGDDMLFVSEKSDLAADKAREIINKEYARAKELILENKPKLMALVKELMDKNSLSSEQLKAIIQGE